MREDFLKPKIIYPETTMGAYFAFDPDAMQLDKTCFMMITSDAAYIQASLSSKLFEFAYKRIYASVALGQTGYQYNKHALVELPICPKPQIEEHLTDGFFYRQYNISQDEVNFVVSYQSLEI